jgi:1-acyl-sn-glycerol-3-phosphate acyltransferase
VISPTPEQLALLSPRERFWFRVADLSLRYLRGPLVLWNCVFMVHFAKLMNGSRWRVHGMEHVSVLTNRERIVMVSNHRSFFDFYVSGTFLFTRKSFSKRMLFPVRSEFFYDSWFGGFVNLLMSGFYMFPPVLRGPKRRNFNRYALDRMVAELEVPGQLIGIHPEGTRGKGDDPYTFLRTQPGAGQILLAAKGIHVLPVFVYGLSNSMKTEFYRTWFTREPHPIDIVYGPLIDFDDLRAKGNRLTLQLEASQRAMDAVSKLAHYHRTAIAGEE